MILVVPAGSLAFHQDRFDDFDRDWWFDYYMLERERIQSQEEQFREIGREKRREELEQEKRQKAVEFQDYLGAKIEASRAAIRSPQGAFYRRPGVVTTELPAGSQALEVGGLKYRYFSGVFYLEAGSRYIVVPAPIGAAVDALPEQSTELATPAGTLQYYFGTFYAAKGGRFEVVRPPAGVVVYYLPDGYEQVEDGGATLYRFGEVTFKPYLIQGFLAFVTTGG